MMQPERRKVAREPKETRQVEERPSNNEYLIDVAAKWADHRFSSYEGRRFACVHGGDSILQRAATLGLFLTAREIGLLERNALVGAIVELGCSEPPMLYGDFDTMKSDWLELHRSFDAPFTEEESIAFAVWPTAGEPKGNDDNNEDPEALGA